MRSFDQGKNAVYMKSIPDELLTFYVDVLINSEMINITHETTFNVSFDIHEKKPVFFPFDKVSTVAFCLDLFYVFGVNKMLPIPKHPKLVSEDGKDPLLDVTSMKVTLYSCEIKWRLQERRIVSFSIDTNKHLKDSTATATGCEQTL